MFEIVKYKKEHIIPMLDQKANIANKELFLSGQMAAVEAADSFTGLLDGKPVLCGGVFQYWNGRGLLWSVFNEECKSNFVPVFRGIKKFLSEQLKIYNRIEVAIPCDFEAGKRRIKLLGFKLECEKAEKFLPNGQDCALYALVRQ